MASSRPRRRRTDPTGLTPADVGRLYVEGRDDLFRLVWLILRDATVAEDVVQEAYTRLYANPGAVRDVTRVDAYLRSTALNLVRSRFTRRSRRSRHDLRIARDPTSPARWSDADPMRHVDDRSDVADALGVLSPNQRICVVCRYWLGLTDSETAAATGMAPGTVKTHLRRALTTLRRDLADPDMPPKEATRVR